MSELFIFYTLENHTQFHVLIIYMYLCIWNRNRMASRNCVTSSGQGRTTNTSPIFDCYCTAQISNKVNICHERSTVDLHPVHSWLPSYPGMVILSAFTQKASMWAKVNSLWAWSTCLKPQSLNWSLVLTKSQQISNWMCSWSQASPKDQWTFIQRPNVVTLAI